MGWTRKSYDALHYWVEGDEKRNLCRKILEKDGLHEIVNRLETAKTLGTWYDITLEAAYAVGPSVVAQSAKIAEQDLNKAAAALGRNGGRVKSEAKTKAARENAKKPRPRPKKNN
jgi:hypothetical protein